MVTRISMRSFGRHDGTLSAHSTTQTPCPAKYSCAEFRKLRLAAQAIRIEMIDRQPPVIFLDQHKRRTGDDRGIRHAEPLGDGARQIRLAGTSGPLKPTTAPGNRCPARRRPNASVSARLCAVIDRGFMRPVRDTPGNRSTSSLGLGWKSAPISCAPSRPCAKERLNELVDVAVEHVLHLGGLHVGAHVLDQRVRLHDVVADLAAPGHLALLVVQLLDLGLAASAPRSGRASP